MSLSGEFRALSEAVNESDISPSINYLRQSKRAKQTKRVVRRARKRRNRQGTLLATVASMSRAVKNIVNKS